MQHFVLADLLGQPGRRRYEASIFRDWFRRPDTVQEDLDLSKPVELIILAVKQGAVRCRLFSNHSVITLRASWSKPLVSSRLRCTDDGQRPEARSCRKERFR